MSGRCCKLLIDMQNPYEALLRSIEFFSQNLHIDQITQYGFELFKDLIDPKQAVLYMLSDEVFHPVYAHNYKESLPDITCCSKHSDFAIYNGFILDNKTVMKKYFEGDFLDRLNVTYIMPLISGNRLIGFILFNRKEDPSQLDFTFMIQFNHLMNFSIEKALKFEEHTRMKSEITKRLFSLSSLSHTTKLLMSELEKSKIHQICIDVIREMTSSSVTAIFTQDTVTGHLATRVYKDIVHFEKKHLSLILTKPDISPSRMVYHVKRDRKKLSLIFENADILDTYPSEYLILLAGPSISGCITIAAPVGPVSYDDTLLEQLSIVAGIAQLALTNAEQFDEIHMRKESFKLQNQQLRKLNKAVRTINSSETLEELCESTLNTLQFTFGVETAFLALRSSDTLGLADYKVTASIGLDDAISSAPYSACFTDALDGSSIHSYTACDLSLYLQPDLVQNITDSNCLIIAPITSSSWSFDPEGYLVLLKQNKALTEEQCILVESLCNSIAPAILQLKQLSQLGETHIPCPEKKLRALFDTYENDKTEFGIDYRVSMKRMPHTPFTQMDYTPFEAYDFVHLHDILIVYAQTDTSDLSMDIHLMPTCFEEIIDQVQKYYIPEVRQSVSCS